MSALDRLIYIVSLTILSHHLISMVIVPLVGLYSSDINHHILPLREKSALKSGIGLVGVIGVATYDTCIVISIDTLPLIVELTPAPLHTILSVV